MRITEYPQELARRAAMILGADLETSITVRQHGLTVRAGSSTRGAARCDQAEAMTGSGPCVAAMEQHTARVVPAIADAHEWPRWRDQALKEGFVSALAVPAPVHANASIALNLYSRTPDPWTPGLLTAADGYVQVAADMTRLHLTLAELEDTTAGLYREMSDTVATERAVGAIMHTNGCSEEEAVRILETASNHRNVSRREVAEAVLRALVEDEQPSSSTSR